MSPRFPLLVLACCPLPAMAQSALYVDVTATHLPTGLAGACMDAAAGDADGDGDLDLALAMEFQPKVLLLNDGSGKFTDASAQLPGAVHDSEDVVFADMDGDGDPDLVWVSEDDSTDELYLNDGKGVFLDASERLVTDDVSNALVVFDLDGDGALDILSGNIGTDHYLHNDGTGHFTVQTDTRWPQDGMSRTQDLELVDVDGDGDLDMAVANEGQNQLFLNDGGTLRDVTTTHLPVADDESREMRGADVDGDGDMDLLVANVSFLRREQVPQDVLLLNDGSGHFTAAPVDRFPEDARSNFTVQAVDLDRDGDLDAVMPSTVFPSGELSVVIQAFTADGTPVIVHAPGVANIDTDGDGDRDARIFLDGTTYTFINEGERLMALEEPIPQQVKMDTYGEDGMVLGFASHSIAGVMQNMMDLGPTIYSDMRIDVIDHGQDGHIEAMGISTSWMTEVGTSLVLLNDGPGTFTRAEPGSVLPASVSGNTFDIEVADFNADGIDDLFFCNRASVTDNPVATGGLQQLLMGRP